MRRLLPLLALIATSAAGGAHDPVPYPHAQEVADAIVARDPELIDVILHVSPTSGAPNVVVAAHLRHANGEASGEDDLGVARTGAPLVEVQKDGARLGILLQLRDSHRRAIGAIGLMWPYRPGDDVEQRLRRSLAIRDALASRIPSLAALVGRSKEKRT